MWQRWEISDWAIRGVEATGSTEAVWLAEPETGHVWLHKSTVIPANGIEQGEDWSEVIATQVGVLLEVPCAPTRLCVRSGRRGSISRSVVPKGNSLWEGNLAMERAGLPDSFPHLDHQPSTDPRRPGVKRPGHSLANIRRALDGLAAPTGFPGPADMNAFDVFAGYLMLDALIANPDRHVQNWAVISPPLTSEPERLAPSYDHASSLGFNLPDARRQTILDSGNLRRWAERGRAVKFEHIGKAATLVEHAADALTLCTPVGAAWWRTRVESLDLEPVLEPLRRGVIPAMSDLAVSFAYQLLELNQRRLRDALRTRD